MNTENEESLVCDSEFNFLRKWFNLKKCVNVYKAQLKQSEFELQEFENALNLDSFEKILIYYSLKKSADSEDEIVFDKISKSDDNKLTIDYHHLNDQSNVCTSTLINFVNEFIFSGEYKFYKK